MDNVNEILKILESNKVDYILYYSVKGFESVKKVVETLGVDMDMVIKTMIVYSKNKLYTFLVRGGKKLDMDVVRGELQDDDARLATPKEMKEYLGIEPGEASPFHPKVMELRTYLDLDSTRYDRVIVGGGSKYHVIQVSLDDLVRVLKPFYVMI